MTIEINNLIATTRTWKEKADNFLTKTDLIRDLSKYGEVHIVGAYRYDLMMHGDIDISVVREKLYSIDEVFEIFRDIYFMQKFRSYFIGGNWDDPRKGNEFPEGYYIGLKEKINGERWKVDIWFIDQKEFNKRTKDDSKFNTLTDDERALILACKQYRNANKLSITGQEIYNSVFERKWKNLEDFKKEMRSRDM